MKNIFSIKSKQISNDIQLICINCKFDFLKLSILCFLSNDTNNIFNISLQWTPAHILMTTISKKSHQTWFQLHRIHLNTCIQKINPMFNKPISTHCQKYYLITRIIDPLFSQRYKNRYTKSYMHTKFTLL